MDFRKKIFLTKNYEGTTFHPRLSEFMEMAAQCEGQAFPDNFRGLMAYFVEDGLKDGYGITYFWMNDEGKEETSILNDEFRFRSRLQQYPDQLRISVRAVGWIDKANYLKRPDYNHLDSLEYFKWKFGLMGPDPNAVNQLAFYFMQERVLNGSKFESENVFFYPDYGDVGRMSWHDSELWLETIDKAMQLSKEWSSGVHANAGLEAKSVALESIKKVLSTV